jgi:hypothetical protein
MPNYFAEFRDMGGFWIRHNTRIYLDEFNGTQPTGQCLGAIIAKNPGSAKGAVAGWGAINLDHDQLLTNVRSILSKAFDQAAKEPPLNAYIQVLNLFYICDKDLDVATAMMVKAKKSFTDPAESNSFPFVWFAWGGESADLDHLKARFVAAHGKSRVFFYCQNTRSIVSRLPSNTDWPRHTQGMRHEPVIAHLATFL